MRSGAVISQCGRYRYRLWREWSDGPTVVFCGVNPSTADATQDDATIRKCVGFATRWGFGSLEMVNLFAWRDTDQRALAKVSAPIGIETDCHILQAYNRAERIVFAWGAGKTVAVRKLIDERALDPLFSRGRRNSGSLGRTLDGHPRHPLMLAYATPFEALS